MRIRGRASWAVVFSFVFGMVVLLAGPALAQGKDLGNLVVIRGSVTVPEGDTAGSVFIVDGPARIDGTVDGSVVALHGPVFVAGTVHGSVISASNHVVVMSGALIDGDVRSHLAPVIADRADVSGTVGTVNYSKVGDIARVSRYIWWFGVTVSTLVLGLGFLLLPAGARTAIQDAATRIGPSIGWGALAFFGLPIAAVILLVIVITLPLGLALLFALGLLYLAGYVAAAWVLGGRVARRSPPFVAYLAGWGILRGVALIPILAGAAWTLAAWFGLGALAVAIWTKRSGAEPPPAVPAIPAIPAPPPPA